MHDLRDDLKVAEVRRRKGRIRQRHFAVDVIAGAAGSSFVYALHQKSWEWSMMVVVLIVVLYIIDRIGIENEERFEKD